MMARTSGLCDYDVLTSMFFLAGIWRAGWLPGLVLVAFGPLIARGIMWLLESPRPLQVHRLGVTELFYAVVFGLFFIVAYHPWNG